MNDCVYGFRIRGSVQERRWSVELSQAFAAHAACDPRAEVHRESYLSAFCFGRDFHEHLSATRSTKKFRGPCGACWVSWDIDRENVEGALLDTRRLWQTLQQEFTLLAEEVLIFFSGSKGFHLGLPTALWQPTPSESLHRITRQFAEDIANKAGTVIDVGICDQVRAFRAPNSKHPKTGLHKRRLSAEQLCTLSLSEIQQLAEQPAKFELPVIKRHEAKLAALWAQAESTVQDKCASNTRSLVDPDGHEQLHRATLRFIQEGAQNGERVNRLFQAAANLTGCGCPRELLHALFRESALDSGLAPGEVTRQIDNAFAYVKEDARV